MPTASLLSKRISLQGSAPLLRYLSNGRPKYERPFENGRRGERMVREKSRGEDKEKRALKTDEPSLFDQLFPDQQSKTQQNEERELPRVPLQPDETARRYFTKEESSLSYLNNHIVRFQQRKLARGEDEPGVLVLRNASKNLVEDDFRRLTPRGQHMEGWKLEQGDILKIIPERNWQSLEQQNNYYLLFSSGLSAFYYRQHVMRVSRIVKGQTPNNLLSPMIPPEGYLLEGIDASDAIASFSLLAPNAYLDLRMLQPPLSPVMKSIVKNGGYASLLNRKDRSPYELRLTLDGPQLHASRVRHILLRSGQDRRLSWSGGTTTAPRVTEWNPSSQFAAPSVERRDPNAEKWSRDLEAMEEGKEARNLRKLSERGREDEEQQEPQENLGLRTRQKIYILGFQTENAMQSFMYYWHQRPMEYKEAVPNRHLGEDYLAPITHLEMLW